MEWMVWMGFLGGLLALWLLVLLWRRPDAGAELLQALAQQQQRLDALQERSLRLEGAVQALGPGWQASLQAAQQASAQAQEVLRQAVESGLTQAVAEARQSRADLQAAFQGLETKLEQRLSGAQAAQGQWLQAAQAGQTQRLTALQTLVAAQLEAQDEQATQRAAALQSQLTTQFAALQAQLTQQLDQLAQGQQRGAEQVRAALNERLTAIQEDNGRRLDDMRRTVDEKLQSTLEQRLGESFRLVSERLEQVQQGLGEMKSLAGSVGDLRRVMSNVKTRGTWGEVQLGAILDAVLTPEQYARNVKTCANSDELVEFAIRLPGKQADAPVWLPIDAKFPLEAYQRLQDAQDALDKVAVQQAANALDAAIRHEAKKIASKYLCPPHTTDFAVLYLPSESLFAEVLRRPGVVESVQHDFRVVLTGPANLAAMLNSLQMGFKTLAIEKRSSEVWQLLGLVKTEFAKFGEVVDATKRSIDAAAAKFNEVGVRTRAIQRKLRDVQELPADALPPLPLDAE